jgi:hypothetical protein
MILVIDEKNCKSETGISYGVIATSGHLVKLNQGVAFALGCEWKDYK